MDLISTQGPPGPGELGDSERGWIHAQLDAIPLAHIQATLSQHYFPDDNRSIWSHLADPDPQLAQQAAARVLGHYASVTEEAAVLSTLTFCLIQRQGATGGAQATQELAHQLRNQRDLVEANLKIGLLTIHQRQTLIHTIDEHWTPGWFGLMSPSIRRLQWQQPEDMPTLVLQEVRTIAQQGILFAEAHTAWQAAIARRTDLGWRRTHPEEARHVRTTPYLLASDVKHARPSTMLVQSQSRSTGKEEGRAFKVDLGLNKPASMDETPLLDTDCRPAAASLELAAPTSMEAEANNSALVIPSDDEYGSPPDQDAAPVAAGGQATPPWRAPRPDRPSAHSSEHSATPSLQHSSPHSSPAPMPVSGPCTAPELVRVLDQIRELSYEFQLDDTLYTRTCCNNCRPAVAQALSQFEFKLIPCLKALQQVTTHLYTQLPPGTRETVVHQQVAVGRARKRTRKVVVENSSDEDTERS